MITPIRPIGSIPSRLPQRPGVEQGKRRRVHCDYCSDSYSTAKPQDPEREKDHGTCEGCRSAAAADWIVKHNKPMSQALTRFARLA